MSKNIDRDIIQQFDIKIKWFFTSETYRESQKNSSTFFEKSVDTSAKWWYNNKVVGHGGNYGQINMRACWNWQTGTFEGRVFMTCGFKSHCSHQKKAHRWCAFFNEICRCASSEMAAPWNAPMVREISAYADVKSQISFHRERSSLFHNLRQANYFTSSKGEIFHYKIINVYYR